MRDSFPPVKKHLSKLYGPIADGSRLLDHDLCLLQMMASSRRRSQRRCFVTNPTIMFLCVFLSFRMIPANHKYFLLSDLASSREYELCVLAVYDDGITALTGTKLVGCVSFSTETEYGRCHSIRDQVSALLTEQRQTNVFSQTSQFGNGDSVR